jgi:hypothetical protein
LRSFWVGCAAGFSPAAKPQVLLTARPLMAFTPAKIAFIADLRGGADDYEDFYCASIEWDWDDGTKSESAADCEPYQAGKSQIRRHFTAEHTYDMADSYKPTFKLKKRNKIVGLAKVEIEVRPGLVP